MKLSEAKKALHGYLDMAAVLGQMRRAGEPVPAEWTKDANAQVWAMVREIDRCRTMGRAV